MSAIRAAAGQLAAAKVEAEQAAVTLKDANTAVTEIRERLESLEAERDQIKADRLAGEVSADQGARLAALAVDTEGLSEIFQERQAVQSAAASEFGRLSQAVTSAAAMLSNASDHALIVDLKVIATELDAKLLATVGEITAVAKRVGSSRAMWLPSSLLANRLRSLDMEGQAR
jgi:hypothetical protein